MSRSLQPNEAKIERYYKSPKDALNRSGDIMKFNENTYLLSEFKYKTLI